MSEFNITIIRSVRRFNHALKQFRKNKARFLFYLAFFPLICIIFFVVWSQLRVRTSQTLKIFKSTRISNIKLEPEFKHFLSACVIAKQSSDILPEFIVRNYAAGVDHFYIYGDDEDNPEEKKRLYQIFSQLPGLVTYIPNGRGAPQDQENLDTYVQMRMYRHCIYTYGHNTKWLALIDTDEFFETYALPTIEKDPLKIQRKAFLHNFLAKFNALPAICVRWRSALTNGQLLPGRSQSLLHDQFPETCQISSVDNGKLAYKKTVMQTRFVDLENTPKEDLFIHTGFRFRGPGLFTNLTCHHELGKNLEPPFHLVHYWSRDLASYLCKIQRGRPRKGIHSRSLEDLFQREELCIPDGSLSSSHIRLEHIRGVMEDLPRFVPDLKQIAKINFSLQSEESNHKMSFCETHVSKLVQSLADGHDFSNSGYCTGRKSTACSLYKEGGPLRWPFPWFEYISSCEDVTNKDQLFI